MDKQAPETITNTNSQTGTQTPEVQSEKGPSVQLGGESSSQNNSSKWLFLVVLLVLLLAVFAAAYVYMTSMPKKMSDVPERMEKKIVQPTATPTQVLTEEEQQVQELDLELESLDQEFEQIDQQLEQL